MHAYRHFHKTCKQKTLLRIEIEILWSIDLPSVVGCALTAYRWWETLPCWPSDKCARSQQLQRLLITISSNSNNNNFNTSNSTDTVRTPFGVHTTWRCRTASGVLIVTFSCKRIIRYGSYCSIENLYMSIYVNVTLNYIATIILNNVLPRLISRRSSQGHTSSHRPTKPL